MLNKNFAQSAIKECYNMEPIRYTETEIPVFAEVNEYIENYDQISADHLEKELGEGENPFMPDDLRVSLENSTLELLNKYTKPGDKVLDAGVALGRLLKQLDGVQKYGFDISSGYLKESQKAGIEVCLSTAEELPYKNEYFDIVVCTDMLEHVFDLYKVITNLFAVLKPGGKLIVRVPQNEFLMSYFSDQYPYKYVHMRTFDRYSLQALFEKIFGQKILEFKVVPYSSGISQPYWDLLDINEKMGVASTELQRFYAFAQKEKFLALKGKSAGRLRRMARFVRHVYRLHKQETKESLVGAKSFLSKVITIFTVMKIANFLYEPLQTLQTQSERLRVVLENSEFNDRMIKGEINVVIEKFENP